MLPRQEIAPEDVTAAACTDGSARSPIACECWVDGIRAGRLRVVSYRVTCHKPQPASSAASDQRTTHFTTGLNGDWSLTTRGLFRRLRRSAGRLRL